ncbi:collagen alpha-2(I) chain-like [Drosophila bipectinata]|uniref:collagen alpha-2(I) chain-like n=1 Tax=Drosophila bipectinata TaxID=42026 RepID=UPI001C892D2D|nr:collagen alpha-2(I) chain-like [Drosophila bipectinata]
MRYISGDVGDGRPIRNQHAAASIIKHVIKRIYSYFVRRQRHRNSRRSFVERQEGKIGVDGPAGSRKRRMHPGRVLRGGAAAQERGAGPAPASGVGQSAAVPDEGDGEHGEGPRQGDCPNAKEEREGGQAAAHRRTPEGNGQGEGENGTAAADPEDSGDCEEKGRRRKGATGQKMEGEDTADATPQTGEAGGEAVQGDLGLEEGPGVDAVARGAPDTVSTGEEGGAAVGEGAVGVARAAEACAGPADILPREAAGKAGAGAAGIGRRRARCAGRQLAAGAGRKGEGGDDQAAK